MDKKEAIRIITECAKLYKEHFIKKCVLFVYYDATGLQARETIYKDSNFLHLTGVSSTLSPRDFFYRCTSHKLSEEDFILPKDGKADLKLSVLNELMHLPFRAKIIGDYDGMKIYLHTNMVAGSIYASMGFVNTGKVYSPNTALNEDVREIVIKACPILLTFRREVKDPQYSECCYRSKLVTEKELNQIKETLLNEYNILID